MNGLESSAIVLDCTICGKPVASEHLLICDNCLKRKHKHSNGPNEYLCYREFCTEPRIE